MAPPKLVEGAIWYRPESPVAPPKLVKGAIWYRPGESVVPPKLVEGTIWYRPGKSVVPPKLVKGTIWYRPGESVVPPETHDLEPTGHPVRTPRPVVQGAPIEPSVSSASNGAGPTAV